VGLTLCNVAVSGTSGTSTSTSTTGSVSKYGMSVVRSYTDDDDGGGDADDDITIHRAAAVTKSDSELLRPTTSTNHSDQHAYVPLLLLPGPGNGSPMATNVVLGLVVLLGAVVSTKAFFISQPIVVKLRIQIPDNVLQNRTVSDFQVMPKLVNKN